MPSLSVSTSMSCAVGGLVKSDPIITSIARFEAAMASSRNCMLLTDRKFAVPRLSAAISMIVISTSMISPTTSAAPRSERDGCASWRHPPAGDIWQADGRHVDVALECVVIRAHRRVARPGRSSCPYIRASARGCARARTA